MNPPPQQKNLHVLLFKLVFETSPSFKMATFLSWMTGTPVVGGLRGGLVATILPQYISSLHSIIFSPKIILTFLFPYFPHKLFHNYQGAFFHPKSCKKHINIFISISWQPTPPKGLS